MSRQVCKWLVISDGKRVMAFLKKDEFAGLCFCTTSDLATYRRRGKIVLSGEFYDDTNEVNKAFVEYRKKFAPDVVAELPAPKIETPQTINPAPKINKASGGDNSFTELERKKLQLENEKNETVIEKNRLQIAKLNGESIPTELAKLVMVQQSKSYIVFLKQTHENMITEIAAAAGLSSKATADLRTKNTALINKMVAEVHTESKKMITNIVKTFSDTRGKGERK